MPRCKFTRRLPALGDSFADFSGFAPGQNQKEYLVAKLRSLAEKLRKNRPQAFYTMREIAGFFGISLRSAALIYEALEKEGVLSRIRGSHTMLSGRRSVTRSQIRGLVGIPIWSEMFALSAYTRRVNTMLAERLRQKGFVADLIFHETKKEEEHPDFSERLVRHQPDVVVWQNAAPESLQNILALRDFGVRIFSVQTTEAETDLPVVGYRQDWKPAYRRLGEEWRTRGIRKVLLPINANHLAYGRELPIFSALMAERGMDVRICGDNVQEVLRRCERGEGAGKLAVGFLETQTADVFCNREPLYMERIFSMARVGFCRGRLTAPYLEGRGLRADIVAMDADEVADRLAGDITNLPLVADGLRHTFEARLFPAAIEVVS